MTNQSRDLTALARRFHNDLPDRIRQYLNGRGITDELIEKHLLGWNGWRITIPIFSGHDKVAFFKQAKDPDNKSESPKMIAWPKGHFDLYGRENLKDNPTEIIICEGEFDRLVLEANGFKAVTSTGGAKAFKREWAREFESIPEVYICFDNDEAGKTGALRVARLIPHAKIVELPGDLGEGGDVTDFFVRLGRSREEFLKLLQEAKPSPAETDSSSLVVKARNSDSRARIERVKHDNPIVEVIGRYMKLQPSGSNLVGLCPFHEEHISSFTVYPATGRYYCYGCGKHGDVISFIREKEGLNFNQALDALDRFISQHESGSQ